MTKRITTDEKEARRFLRAFLSLGGRANVLSAQERKDMVRRFIKVQIVAMDRTFPDYLDFLNPLLRTLQQPLESTDENLEPLAVKIAELSIRLHRQGHPKVTVH